MKQTISERKAKFIERMKEYLINQDRNLMNEFYLYWTEHNEGGKKMRFEMEKVFNIKRRFGTWKRNSESFKGVNKKAEVTKAKVIKETDNGTFVDYSKYKTNPVNEEPTTLGQKLKRLI